MSIGKVIAFIPVRGGSKGIPKKNIKPMAGKPLVYYVLKAAIDAQVIDEVILSTDSEEIIRVVKNLFPNNSKIRYQKRSAATSTDTASTEAVMLEYALCDSSFEQIVLLQATSPLTRHFEIDEAFRHYYDSRAGGLISVVEQKRFIWQESIPQNYSPENRKRRQELKGYNVENGAIYITSRKKLLESNCRVSKPYITYNMPEETYYEIDEPSDWNIVEGLIRNRKESEAKFQFKKIKAVIFDFDGVFTDNKVIVFQNGEEAVICDRSDGMGISMLKQAGIECWVISKEKNPVLKARCAKLGIDCYHGVDDKLSLLKKQINEKKINSEDIAYLGNDVNDIEAMKFAGIGIAVSDSNLLALNNADYILNNKGGDGAIRELCEIIISSVNSVK